MSDEREIESLYQELLSCWNRRDARDFAALVTKEATLVGFDGSTHSGRAAVETDLTKIFAAHQTPAFVGKIKTVRLLTTDVAVLTAVAGLVPAGSTDINVALNSVQTLVAAKQNGQWRIAVFQNTPAAFHGRPELCEKLTEELRQELKIQTAAKAEST
jgi:uncharacterized protein (TIGR02246 family)